MTGVSAMPGGCRPIARIHHPSEVSVSFIATAIGTKVAIAALSLAALGGGTAVAAAAGVLPAPAQDFAHNALGAPSPSANETETPEATESPEATDAPTPEPTATAAGPDATGPAAFGLCTAYTKGGLSTHSVAYGALKSAAIDGDIAGYCSTVLADAHGHSADDSPSAHHSDPAESGDDGSDSEESHGHSGHSGHSGSHGH
jgi:hypothetical protein